MKEGRIQVQQRGRQDGTSERGEYSGAAEGRQDGTSERGEYSGAAEGRTLEKEQKQPDDALLLEEIVELD